MPIRRPTGCRASRRIGAEVIIHGPAGRRRLAIADFIMGVFEIALATGRDPRGRAHSPAVGRRARFGFYKICRKTGELAQAIGAVLHDPGTRGLPRRHRRDRSDARSSIADAASLFEGAIPARAPARVRRAAATASARGTRAWPTVSTNADSRRRLAARIRRGRPAVKHDPPDRQRQSRHRRTSSRARSLADFLRETLVLTGTHLGCEHGVCGACTLLGRRRAGARPASPMPSPATAPTSRRSKGSTTTR